MCGAWYIFVKPTAAGWHENFSQSTKSDVSSAPLNMSISNKNEFEQKKNDKHKHNIAGTDNTTITIISLFRLHANSQLRMEQ